MVPRGLVGYMFRGSVLMLSELRLYALMEVGEKDEPRAAERERERERERGTPITPPLLLEQHLVTVIGISVPPGHASSATPSGLNAFSGGTRRAATNGPRPI